MGAGASALTVPETPSTDEAMAMPPNSAHQHEVVALDGAVHHITLEGIEHCDSKSVACMLFEVLDADCVGRLLLEDLVMVAKLYFSTLPTSQPEVWIRSMITKHDANRDGALSEAEFACAVDSLRRC